MTPTWPLTVGKEASVYQAVQSIRLRDYLHDMVADFLRANVHREQGSNCNIFLLNLRSNMPLFPQPHICYSGQPQRV